MFQIFLQQMAGIVLAICLACSTKDIINNTKSMHIGTPSCTCATSTGHTSKNFHVHYGISFALWHIQ